MNIKRSTIILSVILTLFAISIPTSPELDAQNVAITDEDAYTAHPDAMLDVKSATKGILIPRLSTAQRNAISTPPDGLLVFDNDMGSFFYSFGETWINLATGDIWGTNGTDVFLSDPSLNMGIGTTSPYGKLDVKGDMSGGVNDPIFQVLNSNNDTIFAVYPEGVRILVSSGDAKGAKGGFAIGGIGAKAGEQEYLRVTPDSVRIYIKEEISAKGAKGGFAIGGFGSTSKGEKEYLSIFTDTSAVIINPSKPAMLWYPIKQAFLVGRVLVESPDSVGWNSMAAGYEAKAVGRQSQAFGYKTRSAGWYSTAIGKEAVVDGHTGFALGMKSHSVGNSSFAIGNEAQTLGDGSYAIGSIGRDQAGNPIGLPTSAEGDYSFAIGLGTKTTGVGSLAMGNGAQANNFMATAIGWNSVADGLSSISMGHNSSTSTNALNSIALGSSATSTKESSIAMGGNASSTAMHAVAIGYQNQASALGALAMGYNSIASGEKSTALGGGNTAAGDYSFASGQASYAGGDYSFSFGERDSATAVNAIAMGSFSKAKNDFCIAMGYSSEATGVRSVAIGDRTKATGNYSTAFGSETNAISLYATAAGYRTTASGGSSVALGANTTAGGAASFAMGNGVIAGGATSVALGKNAQTNANGSFVFGDASIGPELVVDTANQFVVRADGGYLLYSHWGLNSGVRLGPGAGSWSELSDRNAKENFVDIDEEEVLEKIAVMAIQSWNYKTQDESIRHVGPVAQDFYAAFGLGDGDKMITSVDRAGINMLAIQALEKRTDNLAKENELLRQENESLKEEISMIQDLKREIEILKTILPVTQMNNQ